MRFADRSDAGRRLAAALLRFKAERPVVLALPRGGVPVGFEIAEKLEAPLDALLVRKIGHPAQPELAIGAVADGDAPIKEIDGEAVRAFGVPQAYLDREVARQLGEIAQRRRLYFKDRKRVDLRGRTAILVDDGIATGATMRAALRSVRRRGVAKLVLAVPVAPADTIEELRREADEVICLHAPADFGAVGLFYADFRPVEDEQVVALLERAMGSAAGRAPPSAASSEEG